MIISYLFRVYLVSNYNKAERTGPPQQKRERGSAKESAVESQKGLVAQHRGGAGAVQRGAPAHRDGRPAHFEGDSRKRAKQSTGAA